MLQSIKITDADVKAFYQTLIDANHIELSVALSQMDSSLIKTFVAGLNNKLPKGITVRECIMKADVKTQVAAVKECMKRVGKSFSDEEHNKRMQNRQRIELVIKDFSELSISPLENKSSVTNNQPIQLADHLPKPVRPLPTPPGFFLPKYNMQNTNLSPDILNFNQLTIDTATLSNEIKKLTKKAFEIVFSLPEIAQLIDKATAQGPIKVKFNKEATWPAMWLTADRVIQLEEANLPIRFVLYTLFELFNACNFSEDLGFENHEKENDFALALEIKEYQFTLLPFSNLVKKIINSQSITDLLIKHSIIYDKELLIEFDKEYEPLALEEHLKVQEEQEHTKRYRENHILWQEWNFELAKENVKISLPFSKAVFLGSSQMLDKLLSAKPPIERGELSQAKRLMQDLLNEKDNDESDINFYQTTLEKINRKMTLYDNNIKMWGKVKTAGW